MAAGRQPVDGLLARPHPASHLLLPPPRHCRHHQRETATASGSRASSSDSGYGTAARLDDPWRTQGDSCSWCATCGRASPPASPWTVHAGRHGWPSRERSGWPGPRESRAAVSSRGVGTLDGEELGPDADPEARTAPWRSWSVSRSRYPARRRTRARSGAGWTGRAAARTRDAGAGTTSTLIRWRIPTRAAQRTARIETWSDFFNPRKDAFYPRQEERPLTLCVLPDPADAVPGREPAPTAPPQIRQAVGGAEAPQIVDRVRGLGIPFLPMGEHLQVVRQRFEERPDVGRA